MSCRFGFLGFSLSLNPSIPCLSKHENERPGALPVSAGCAQGVFVFERCSNTARTLHRCNIAQKTDSKKSLFSGQE